MIAHHQGALAMVDELYAAGGGIEPAVGRTSPARSRPIRPSRSGG